MLVKKVWKRIVDYLNINKITKIPVDNSIFVIEKDLIIDDFTKKIYLLVKTKSRSLGTKFELDDLLKNSYIIDNLDIGSIKFLFFTAGLLDGAKCNDIYTLVSFDICSNNVIIRHTATLQEESWILSDIFSKGMFNKLDKQSLLFLTEIYVKSTSKEHTSQGSCEGLRMVK